MFKLLQINSVVNTGSTGHIAEEIGNLVISNGWESYIAYGRKALPSKSKLIHIGNNLDIFLHGLLTRLFDMHGLGSKHATKKLIKKIEVIKPNIIQLHNIHGYYINYKILFKYLSKSGCKVVWTMHDCWALTGHCSHYTYEKCFAWQTEKGCCNCPQKKSYPASFLFSNSKLNFQCKKKYFNLLSEEQLIIVTPSEWLSGEVKKSYLSNFKRLVINNGIDLNVFKPVYNNPKEKKYIILGVASGWGEKKGLSDFIKLAEFLEDNEEILLVGLSQKQIANLPKNKNIRGIERTESQKELTFLYSNAICFVNPTYEDTFPTTNLEALACGTPVITYRTGGSPESIDFGTGYVVNPGDISELRKRIKEIEMKGKTFFIENCTKRVLMSYSKNFCFSKYLNLYEELLRN